MSDRLAVLPQYLLPKQALTLLAGKIAGAQAGHLTTRLIRWFVTRYNVNMDEAANSDIASYQSFNEFFYPAFARWCATALERGFYLSRGWRD